MRQGWDLNRAWPTAKAEGRGLALPQEPGRKNCLKEPEKAHVPRDCHPDVRGTGNATLAPKRSPFNTAKGENIKEK